MLLYIADNIVLEMKYDSNLRQSLAIVYRNN